MQNASVFAFSLFLFKIPFLFLIELSILESARNAQDQKYKGIQIKIQGE